MFEQLRPRRVEVERRANVDGDFLKGWDADAFDTLKFSYGLTGVDQVGNFLWVDTFLYMLAGMAICLLVLRIANMWWRHNRHLSVMSNPSRQDFFATNHTSWWPWLNRYVLAAPLWKKKHNTPFQISSAIDNGTLPGRWHTIMLIVYCALNVAWCCILPWGDERDGAVIAALRGRTGTLAALNLIPTVLFALRNNPLITLLQVSYDDFNLFHRWCARVTILEALVHTVSWMVNTSRGAGWDAVLAGIRDEESYTWGMVGSACFLFIGIQAWSPIRHAFYETFLNIHRITVIGALVGLYLHLERHGLPQIPWMHLIVVFWAGEWIIRLFMIWYYGFKLSRKSAIKVEAMPGEAVRVTIDLVRPWHSRPGCHVHLWVPGMSQLTSHPFSVAWAPPASPTSKEMTLPTLEGQVLAPNAPAKANQISLICRARTGLTRKMYERAANSPNETFSTFGFIEGPYGGHHSLDSYGTVLLFAGGVGITHQVMYLKHLIAGFHRSTTATQKLVLIWTVPDAESLEWVRPWMDEILRMPGRKQVLRVKLFITRPKAPLHNNSETVKMFAGRPKTATLIEEECRTRVGAMAVTVCGSGPFADDVRAAVRPVLTEGSVDFIEEAFTY
ncbi:ferric reductase like transmembrane component-domain-containing protein [Massariosphaeria phaeospora]|uniref:Ferric reductase like transmembrane component-domain-containing protein n=1 Tax=Massariosphaeria phaeospora TaxID=100035 RepID=A0A7C8IBI4_9PLEO|nr:ferric reductase like transmembrane component-domain-containing protein [Massariosphaeria phaeospora]